MNNYHHYANMSKDAKDRMCNHENLQQVYEQIKFSSTTNTNKNNKTSLKRTESKMDENQPVSDDNPEIESEIDDVQWQYQRKSNKRGNKAPRTDSFVQGRTITSSSRGYGRTDNNTTRHPPLLYDERKNERKIDNHQLSNFDGQQQDIMNDIQYLGDASGNKQVNNMTEIRKDDKHIDAKDEMYVSRQALKFAVDDRFPPLKIHCNPEIKNKEDGAMIVKEFFKYIEKDFKKLNPRYNQPLGFDHYVVDNNGSLVCFTNYIELFIYMCDINNYPTDLTNIKIRPILPTKLPACNAIILKFIDNTIKFEDIRIHVNEKLKSVYTIEEMLGTMNYRSRHIRIDLLSKEEYITILNSGKFSIGGHLYDVDEYLPSPRILICTKCNSPGHVKKNCKSTIELCKRCGNDRNDGTDHKNCNIKCHHCGEDHEATNFKCTRISKFRQELLHKLKENKHLLPPHIQFYIPQQFRERKGEKALMNNNVEAYQCQVRQRNIINNNNHHDFKTWPRLNSNLSLPSTTNTIPVWNFELKQMQEELYNIKHEHEIEIKKLRTECETQMQKMAQGWQLINLQFKTQAEAIVDIHTTVSEILPPLVQSIQTINDLLKEMNNGVIGENERQRREILSTTINQTIVPLKNRLCLLTDHQQKLKTLMDKEIDLLQRGMNSMVHSSNEL